MHYRLQSGDGIKNEFCLVVRVCQRTLSSETSATVMARFSLDLRDLEVANALGVVPETQWPSTEAIISIFFQFQFQYQYNARIVHGFGSYIQ